MNFTPQQPPSLRTPPGYSGRNDWWRFLARLRYQLLGAIIFAVLLPAAIRWPADPIPFGMGSRQAALFGTFVAVVAGAIILRRIIYPGVAAFGYVLPVFAVAYAVVIAGFFFFRIDYSRYQFATSFVCTVLWFFVVRAVQHGAYRPRLMLLPTGNAHRLLERRSVDWMIAIDPETLPRGVGGVVADLGAELGDRWETFLARCALNGVPVYHYKQIDESLTGTVEIEHLSENQFGSLIPSSGYLQVKQIIDWMLVLLAAVPVGLVSLWVAWRIKKEDGGAVLFRQERVGYRGETFTMLKFRTMREDAGGKSYTVANDDRVTRIGRSLRHYRLDELPQLINILRGEMSLIGPRPEARELADAYERQIPFYSYRHIVRPGITGWAQVNQGNVAEVAAATTKLHYDFYYIKHFSPWLDLLIAARTVRTILTGFGAR